MNLNDKTLLITGGTGSFGNAVLNQFLKTDVAELTFQKASYWLYSTVSPHKCMKTP